MDKQRTTTDILRKEVEISPLYLEHKQRYTKEWLSNMSGAALFSATITLMGYFLPRLISLLNK
jgi:hypothetical protein